MLVCVGVIAFVHEDPNFLEKRMGAEFVSRQPEVTFRRHVALELE